MDVGPAIVAQLIGNPAVYGMVSNRIYPEFDPNVHRRFPLIVYDLDDAEADEAYDGPTGLVHQTIKIQCVCKTRDQAAMMGKLVKSALDGQGGTWGGIIVQGCFYVTERSSMEPMPGVGTDILLHVRELEFNAAFTNPG